MVDPKEAVKRACARTYESDLAQALLGTSFHPGGALLTDRLADLVQVSPQDRVVDVASGRGTTAIHLARTRHCQVLGVEYSDRQVGLAMAAARAAGVVSAVFAQGDAERLPLPDGFADVVFCECSLCLFPDRAAALREMRRILRPGGRLALAELVLEPARLPETWRGWLATVACLNEAQPEAAYEGMLRVAGFATVHMEPHPEALLELVQNMESRFTLLQALAASDRPAPSSRNPVWAEIRRRIAAGEIGYTLLAARVPETMVGRKGASFQRRSGSHHGR